MIKIQTNVQSDWQQTLTQSITSPHTLLRYLNLPDDLLEGALQANQQFRLFAPIPYLERIEKGNPQDPLLRQILPVMEETQIVSGYSQDPLQEADHRPQKAIVHKYQSRVLVIGTGTCAINCRYCFRRHFPYSDNQLRTDEWQELLHYLQQHPDVNEVILSGGDPLMAKDKILSERVRQLAELPQITRLRIHTRMPVVIPERICEELLSWIGETRLAIVMVFHINHAQEIDHQVSHAFHRLRLAGVTLLNQGVILKGINDSVEAQVDLSETLFRAGVLPYYMFTFDPVAGGAHFDLPVEDAQRLMGKVAARLPGYLVPRLAKEIPGEPAKTVLAPIF